MLPGQTRQSVIVLSPINFYQGLIKLSCGKLPVNVSCTFSPATLAPDGSGNPVQTALTVNTSSSSPVASSLHATKGRLVSLAAVFCFPSIFTGLLIAFNRRRFAAHASQYSLFIALLLLTGVIGLSACGGGSGTKSGNNGDAAPGTSTITVMVTGADNTSHSINLNITVE
jgi:hypothetical protein